MVTYTIRRNTYGEVVARFRLDGKRMPAWDYFGSDNDDAEATAVATVQRWIAERTLQCEGSGI